MDKTQLFDHSWESVTKNLSNQGKILFNLKKLKDFVDNGYFKYNHVQKARRYIKDCDREIGPNGIVILNYVMSTLRYIKFVQ